LILLNCSPFLSRHHAADQRGLADLVNLIVERTAATPATVKARTG
jgi:hypothetical protein